MFSKLFGKQEQGTSSMNAKNDAPLFQERPWVCMIDIDQSVVDAMKESGFNSINSTFGQVIELPTKKLRQSVLCKLPSDGIPDNLHEFDIAVIDLKDRKNTAYEPIDSELSESKIAKQTFIECEYPQTLFDPRPVVGTIFQKVFYDEHKKTITIVFASSNEVIEYNLVDLTSDGYRPRSTGIRYEVYSFLPSTPYMNNKKGFETKVVANSQLSDFLEKYNRDFEYDIVFSHPVIRNGTDLLEDPNFIPLILNRSDEIVSYVQVVDSAMIWVSPN